MFKHVLSAAIGVQLAASVAYAGAEHNHSNSTAISHAPIGVMGDHIHDEGEWMLSYRYSQMMMDGNRTGDDSLSTADVLDDFMVAPLDMRMEMHMFGLMYGATEKLTLMAMVPYVMKSMNHVNRMGVDFNTDTEGLGDVKLSGLYSIYEEKHQQHEHSILLNLGVSLPTGSIDETGDTPAGQNMKLPYPMQLGSGTFDPLLGATYQYHHDTGWNFGSQVGTVLRFGKNNEGYRLGNEYNATAWIAKSITDSASVSFRLDGKSWEDIDGSDRDLNPNMVPTARTDLRAGSRVDALVGVNLYKTDGVLAEHRLAAEFGLPIYQRLDGPQLETDYRFTLGWQLAF